MKLNKLQKVENILQASTEINNLGGCQHTTIHQTHYLTSMLSISAFLRAGKVAASCSESVSEP